MRREGGCGSSSQEKEIVGSRNGEDTVLELWMHVTSMCIKQTVKDNGQVLASIAVFLSVMFYKVENPERKPSSGEGSLGYVWIHLC